jgi:hypothetical protein
VHFLVFEPGAQISNRFSVDSALGYPTVAIFPVQAVSDRDPLNDFCAPFWSQEILRGVVDGAVFRGNPPDGTYDFTTFVMPQPDQDEDGIENTLDPCPTLVNVSGWDPRAPNLQDPGDQDGDGLPDECDPHTTEKSECSAHTGIGGADEDCDGWQNRGDNCPLAVNPEQADADLDSIGDSCDPDPAHAPPPNGVCLVNQLVIGAGGPAPPDPQTLLPCNSGFVLTGDVDCDHDVDRLDLLAWLKDMAGVASVGCPEAIPAGCSDPHADRRHVILQFLRYLVKPDVGIPPCPIP